jgi:hypothetical protein
MAMLETKAGLAAEPVLPGASLPVIVGKVIFWAIL